MKMQISEPPKEVLQLEDALKKYPDTYSIEYLLEKSKDTIDYLENIFIDSFGVKDYSDEHIAHQIFLTDIDEKDQYNYCRCSLWAINKTINTVFKSTGKIETNEKYRELILSLLFETLIFLQRFFYIVHDKEVDYGRFKVNVAEPVQFYLLAESIFEKNLKEKHISTDVIRPTSIFLVRQAIESRIKRILGIKSIYTKQGSVPKIRNEFYFSFLKKHSKQIEIPIDITVLEKIYSWTNIYIHYSIVPPLWKMEWAIRICGIFFKEYKDENSFHIYGGVKVSKELWKNMRQSLKSSIVEYNTELEENDLRIRMRKKPTAKFK